VTEGIAVVYECQEALSEAQQHLMRSRMVSDAESLRRRERGSAQRRHRGAFRAGLHCASGVAQTPQMALHEVHCTRHHSHATSLVASVPKPDHEFNKYAHCLGGVLGWTLNAYGEQPPDLAELTSRERLAFGRHHAGNLLLGVHA